VTPNLAVIEAYRISLEKNSAPMQSRLQDNYRALSLTKKMGFNIEYLSDGTVKATLSLKNEDIDSRCLIKNLPEPLQKQTKCKKPRKQKKSPIRPNLSRIKGSQFYAHNEAIKPVNLPFRIIKNGVIVTYFFSATRITCF
jgi:hypothetical protein